MIGSALRMPRTTIDSRAAPFQPVFLERSVLPFGTQYSISVLLSNIAVRAHYCSCDFPNFGRRLRCHKCDATKPDVWVHPAHASTKNAYYECHHAKKAGKGAAAAPLPTADARPVELSVEPASSVSSTLTEARKRSGKCIDFENGRCTRGADCKFGHVIADGRSALRKQQVNSSASASDRLHASGAEDPRRNLGLAAEPSRLSSPSVPTNRHPALNRRR
jgi:hypothetical protein